MEISEADKKPPSIMRKMLKTVKKLTIEPVMILYVFSFTLTLVVEKQFFLDKACITDLHLPVENCTSLNEPQNEELQVLVHRRVSTFIVWNNLVRQTLPVFFGFCLGNWSDIYGRKIPMVSAMIGKVVYFSGLLLNNNFFSWPLDTVLFTASLPRAITGSDVAMYMATFSYLADVTTPEDRSFRMALMNSCVVICFPVGTALGAYLFKTYNGSYNLLFGICLAVSVLGVIYIVFTVREENKRITSASKCCVDMLKSMNVVSAIRETFRKCSGNNRLYTLILLFSMVLAVSYRDEADVLFLYVQRVFSWDAVKYSYFDTLRLSVLTVGCIILLPLATKVLHMRDTYMSMIGAASLVASRICYAAANEEWLMYLGACFVALAGFTTVAIRSLVSKLTPEKIRGKVFALLSSTEMSVSLFASVIYTQVYTATILTTPSVFFYVTMSCATGVILLVGFLDISLRREEKRLKGNRVIISPEDVCAGEELLQKGPKEPAIVPSQK